MNRKAFVLLSGGIDSTTCLHQAIADFAPEQDIIGPALIGNCRGRGLDWVEAISIDYGQRHIKEAGYAKATCERLGIKHTVLPIGDWVLGGKNTMLTDRNVAIPDISYEQIKGVSPTYVPFRNGTMLSVITAHAQKYVNEQIRQKVVELNSRAPTEGKPHYGADGIQIAQEKATAMAVDLCGVYFGAHAEDAANWAYPDCTPEFIGAMANAIYIGSYRAIRLYAPIQWDKKDDIIRKGERLGVKWAYTWSCYAGGELHCGTCPTCRARHQGFLKAGVTDPTKYASAAEM